MNNRKLLTPLLCLLLICVAAPGYCWDGVGHLLIAQIAYDRLTPAAKAEVDRLTIVLNDDPLTKELEPEDLPVDQINIATWPDEIKSLGAETHQYSAWHYIDLDSLPPVKFETHSGSLPSMPIADGQSIAEVKQYSSPKSDVYEQIITQSKILSDTTASAADRARALAFVEHFVGDIHQPLHAIGRQLGGNRYAIDLTVPDGHITNLHYFWDGAYKYHIVDGQITLDPLLPTSRDSGPDSGSIKTWADQIVKTYLPSDNALLSQTDPAAWAVESNELATSFAFPADNSQTLSNDYVRKAGNIARERLALAGLRLANLLNSTLK